MKYRRPPLPKPLRRAVRRFYRNHALATVAEARKNFPAELRPVPSLPYAIKLAELIRHEATLAIDTPPPYGYDFALIAEAAQLLGLGLPRLRETPTPEVWGFANEVVRQITDLAAGGFDSPPPYSVAFKALADKVDRLAEVLDALADQASMS
jgi:hypothetical protein